MKNVGGLTALYSIGIPQKNRQFFLVSFEKWTKYNNNTNKLHHQITVRIEKNHSTFSILLIFLFSIRTSYSKAKKFFTPGIKPYIVYKKRGIINEVGRPSQFSTSFHPTFQPNQQTHSPSFFYFYETIYHSTMFHTIQKYEK